LPNIRGDASHGKEKFNVFELIERWQTTEATIARFSVKLDA
jgi:hypothetical protein